ncbi:MAG: FAD:protein FMN transferase [Anaerolineales bacterium]|nr:FAD:protein FMN transferase [Anaerolineales bacterium]
MTMQEPPATWHTHNFRAMGSLIGLWLDLDDAAEASAAFARVEALFADNEQALSRFRPESELNQLNDGSGDWVPVSALLWQQVNQAVRMAALTDGYFDPTLANALEQAGYGQTFANMAGDVGPSTVSYGSAALGQWTGVEFDMGRRAIRLPAGVRLDLGGIAKGDTGQQAVALLSDIGPCLVDAGGDLVAGPAPREAPGWPVAIGSPWHGLDQEPPDLAQLWLAEEAMATSGVDYRRWLQGDTMRHHLIDPWTGEPAATDGLTVTVLASQAAVAEAWATATLVAGSGYGMANLLDHDVAGLMVTQTGRILATPAMDEKLQSVVNHLV